jgi:hypothetical protein
MERLDTAPKAIYSLGFTNNVIDLLEGAASVTCFVKEISTRLRESDTQSALTDEAVSGLFLVLQGVEDTLRHVAEMKG